MSVADTSRVAVSVLVAAVVALLFRHQLFAGGLVSLVAQGVAAALMLWARVTFGWRSFHGAANPTSGGLVTSGPYRFLRHPIYAAVLLFVWAGVASHASLPSIALALVASAAVAVRIVCEERLVRERYPEYAGYAATTKRIIPFVF
ncbi:MAG: methyltransferase [bacterium]